MEKAAMAAGVGATSVVASDQCGSWPSRFRSMGALYAPDQRLVRAWLPGSCNVLHHYCAWHVSAAQRAPKDGLYKEFSCRSLAIETNAVYGPTL